MESKVQEIQDIHNRNGQWQVIEFDELVIGDRIGGGGAGVIYKGWFQNREVAIKALFDPRISEDLKQEYLDELLIMSKLKHSNIVEFIGACMTPPNLCYVMELCDSSLFQLLHVDKVQLSDYDIIQIAIDIGSALEYLHSLRPAIIHRDIKSLNILKSPNGSYKVCDFGLVKVRQIQAGTPAYMAPELFENKSFTKAIDVYAFGILLWEICSCRVPFNQVPVSEIRERILRGDRLPLQMINGPKRLSTLIESSWNQNIKERPEFPEIVDILYEISNNMQSTANIESINGTDTLDSMLWRK